MKKLFKSISIILLSFLAFTALSGGWLLIADPSGGIMDMPVSEMRFSPFKDYLIPGIILFSVLGCGSLVLLSFVVFNKTNSNLLLILAGIVVNGWIIVQMIMLAQINWLQFVFVVVGLALIVSGVMLNRVRN